MCYIAEKIIILVNESIVYVSDWVEGAVVEVLSAIPALSEV
jgi:hypothetical protein